MQIMLMTQNAKIIWQIQSQRLIKGKECAHEQMNVLIRIESEHFAQYRKHYLPWKHIRRGE